MEKLILSCIAAVFIIFGNSMTAMSKWRSTFGWNSDDIVSLAAKDGFLFAATSPYDASHSGIFRSSNNGTSWIELDNELSNAVITVVASGPKGVYAVSDSGCIFFSDNHGDKWEKICTLGRVTGFAAMDGGGLFAADWPDIYYSPDGGKNWSKRGTKEVNCLAANGSTLFGSNQYTTSWEGLSTRHGTIYVSVDSGKTWKDFKDKLPDDYFNAVAASNGVVYAGSNGKGTFCSSDNGATWNGCSSAIGDPWDVISLAATDSLLVVGNDAGSFYRKSLSNPSNRMEKFDHCPMDFFTVFNGTVYTGSSDYNGGLFFSRNSGATWNALDSAPTAKTMIIHNGVMLAGSLGSGVYISRDTGRTWTHSDTGLGNDKYIFKLAVSGKAILAATNNSSIYTSRDNGSTWYRSVRVSGTNDVAAFLVSGDTILAGGGDKIFRSDNNAAIWKSIDNSPSRVTDFCKMGNTIFASNSMGGIFSSEDWGLNWVYIGSVFFSKEITALAQWNDLLFAGLNSYGVFVSQDMGKTWTKANTGLYDTTILSLAVVNDTILVGTSKRGIFCRPISEMVGLRSKFRPNRFHSVDIPIKMNISALPGKQVAFDVTTLKPADVTIDIFNISGRLIHTISTGKLNAGNHRFIWNGVSLHSGCCIIRMRAGESRISKNVRLLLN